MVYKERQKHYEELNNTEKSFEPLPSLISENQRKTMKNLREIGILNYFNKIKGRKRNKKD